jgi:hypothetical protein
MARGDGCRIWHTNLDCEDAGPAENTDVAGFLNVWHASACEVLGQRALSRDPNELSSTGKSVPKRTDSFISFF